jgi:hypothetical protein
MFNTAEKKKTCRSLVKGARKEFIMRSSPTLQQATKAVGGKKSHACLMEKIVKLL